MFEIHRFYEDDQIIIYKRLFDLTNCCGDKRYFEFDKKTQQATMKQFVNKTQVKSYLKKLKVK